MKYIKHIVLNTILLLISIPVLASDVETPVIFTSGTAALASEVNANFLEIETAVNDNDVRLSKIETGSIAVHANGFTVPSVSSGSSDCTDHNRFYLFFPTGDSCRAQTSISLPDKATLTGISCTAYDGSSTISDIEVRLHRSNATNLKNKVIFTTTATTNFQAAEKLTDTSPLAGTEIVNNALYFYSLEAFFGPKNGGQLLRLYGCSVSYEL